MTAQLKPAPEAPQDAVQHWRGRVAQLENDIIEAEAALATLEAAAGQAALDGEPLPDIASAEAALRALKRAKVLAEENVERAEADLTAEQRKQHAAAASKLAAERLHAAKQIDAALEQLERHLATFDRLGQHWKEQARLAGGRVRPGNPAGSSRLAGAILAQAPTLFAALGADRPPHAQRQPLAAATDATHVSAMKE